LIAPERMQRVQTFIRFTAEPTMTRTRCRFGIQRRLETLWAWLTRFPKTGALPQTSHIFAIVTPSNKRKAEIVTSDLFRRNHERSGLRPNARNRATYRNLAELTREIKRCNFAAPFYIFGAR
jgi:hypothetical protein